MCVLHSLLYINPLRRLCDVAVKGCGSSLHRPVAAERVSFLSRAAAPVQTSQFCTLPLSSPFSAFRDLGSALEPAVTKPFTTVTRSLTLGDEDVRHGRFPHLPLSRIGASKIFRQRFSGIYSKNSHGLPSDAIIGVCLSHLEDSTSSQSRISTRKLSGGSRLCETHHCNELSLVFPSVATGSNL